MADDNRLSAKSGIDTTDFKTGIAQMNRELRVLESGFRASAAELGDWAKDASGLELRMKSLTSQIDIQKRKVEATRSEYERVAAEKGRNSRAAQDLEIKLNKETETLNKMERELGQTESALQELTEEEKAAGNAAQKMGKEVKESGNRIETLKSVVGGALGTLKALVTTIALVGTVAIGAVTGVSTLTLKYAEQADALDDLSLKTGITKERLQELEFAGGILGTSIDTIASSNARLIRSMSTAAEQAQDYEKKVSEAAASGKKVEDIQLGDVAAAFQTLGVSVTDASGNLRDNEDVFGDLLDALAAIPNETDRDALAMQLFGKSAQELNPLIKAGSDEIERLTEKAHEMGAVVSTETLDAYATLNDTLFAVKKGFQGVVTELLSGFLPGFQGAFEQAGDYLKEFKDIVMGGGDFGQIADGLTGLIARIAEDLAGQAPALLESGLAIVKSIGEAVVKALPSLLKAAVSILQTLIGFIAQNLPTLISTGVEILLTLVDTLIANLPMLIEAALQAVIALATGIADALPELIPAVVQALITIVETLIENLPMLIEAATMLILGLAEGLIIALPFLIDVAPDLMKALVDAIMTALPQFATAAGKLVGMLAYGILANIPVLLTSAGKMIANLLSTLANIPKLVVEVGKGIIDGLISGLSEAQGLLYDAITDIANNALDKIKQTLGIASPSKEGKKIGKNLIASTALGGMEAMRDVERSFAGMTRQLAFAAAGGAAGFRSANGPQVSASTVTTDNSFDVWGNVIIQGDVSRDSLGATLKGKRY